MLVKKLGVENLAFDVVPHLIVTDVSQNLVLDALHFLNFFFNHLLIIQSFKINKKFIIHNYNQSEFLQFIHIKITKHTNKISPDRLKK